jgi:hypothetical protein
MTTNAMGRRNAAYRIVLQLDRADDDTGFDDPVEVFTDEETFALSGSDGDERGRAVMRGIAAAIDAILKRQGVERPGSPT